MNTYIFSNVMFLHLFVSHSVHRGCLPQCMLGYTRPSRQTPPQDRHPQGADSPPPGADSPPGADTPVGADTTPGSRHTLWQQTPPGADAPPAQCMLGDTGNKRAVRILLECILVKIRCLFLHQCIFKMHRMHNIIIDTSMEKPAL